MTIKEIDKYLKKQFFLVFRYNFQYYSLQRSNTLFKPIYSLIATDTSRQQRDSLEKLCEQVYVCNGILLIEAIKYMEIFEWDDPSWKTYEAVRHCAAVYRTEIHFLYKEKSYWIAHASKNFSHLSDNFGNTQSFNSCIDLFENAIIDGKHLKDIWDDVIVDTC